MKKRTLKVHIRWVKERFKKRLGFYRERGLEVSPTAHTLLYQNRRYMVSTVTNAMRALNEASDESPLINQWRATSAKNEEISKTIQKVLVDNVSASLAQLVFACEKKGSRESVRRVLALQNASTADATKARSRAVAAAFRQHDADCGSTRVQVARLSVELEALAAHVAAHPKDKHSTRGYQLKISKRRRLLAYLKRRNPGDYEATLQALGLPTPREGKKRRRARWSIARLILRERKGLDNN